MLTRKSIRFKRNVSVCARRMIDKLNRDGICVHTCRSVPAAAVAICLFIRWHQRARIDGNTLTLKGAK